MCGGNEAAVGQGGMCEMNAVEEQGMGQQRGGRCGEATAVLGNGRTALASCERYEPHRVFNKRHRRTEN